MRANSSLMIQKLSPLLTSVEIFNFMRYVIVGVHVNVMADKIDKLCYMLPDEEQKYVLFG